MSRCPHCQHQNPGDAKFCLECGRLLTLAYGTCCTELPAGAKFCKECGQAVGAASAPTYSRTGEREQAQEHLRTATTMYREMDMRFWLEQAEAFMGGLP